jgi:outer membrane protein insertion porin family
MKLIRLSRQQMLLVSGAVVASTIIVSGALSARTYTAVEVRGAEFIAEDSITAACEIVPGVSYTEEDMGYIRDCLMSSGQFRSVEVAGEGDTLVVSVDEANDRPGRVEIGFAYDSRDGVLGSLYFERYNLFPGVFGAVDLTFAKEVQSLETHFYKAGAFGVFDFGIDTTVRVTSYDDQGFDSARTIIEPFLAYPIGDKGRIEVGIGYRRDEMSDVVGGASALFAAEQGVVEAPFVRFGLRYATNPAENGGNAAITGLSVALDQYFWGLGSDFKTMETRLDASARFALGAKTSVLLGVQGGIVKAEDGGVTRAVDRFFVGGADFRGFAPRGLGPKDGSYFVGANKYYVGTVEVQHELDDLMGTPARIGVFADIGSAWGLDDTLGGTIDDSRRIRTSVGLSMTLDVGSVPVSIYVAKPIDMVDGDEEQNFGISFSTSF